MKSTACLPLLCLVRGISRFALACVYVQMLVMHPEVLMCACFCCSVCLWPQVLDAVLDALESNTRVEALYIQNFEQVGRCCAGSQQCTCAFHFPLQVATSLAHACGPAKTAAAPLHRCPCAGHAGRSAGPPATCAAPQAHLGAECGRELCHQPGGELGRAAAGRWRGRRAAPLALVKFEEALEQRQQQRKQHLSLPNHPCRHLPAAHLRPGAALQPPCPRRRWGTCL